MPHAVTRARAYAGRMSDGLKLLLIVPHPDDEVYGASGTLMGHLEAGSACGLVTLTRGEAGRTLGLCDTPEELARMREVELAACLEVIGLTTPEAQAGGSVFEHHRFPDKYLKDQPMEALTEVAREAMVRLRPEVVLTFPPNGSNGHPDHVTTHRAVKAAWDALPAERRRERDEARELGAALDSAGLPPGFVVDLNSASREDLMRLPRVGEALANRIIERRPYRRLTDLLEVEGIGPSTYRQLKPMLRLDSAAE